MEPITPDLTIVDDSLLDIEPPGEVVAAEGDGRFNSQPPPGWPVHMVWPPPTSLVDSAERAGRSEGQMRLFGRPAFVIDGVTLSMIVDITGHRSLVNGSDNRIHIK